MCKFLLIFFIFPLQVLSQAIIPVFTTDFADAIVSTTGTYDLNTVLEYNDGADLFLEFGFTSLIVQDIVWKDASIKVEIYKMSSPEGAFGAYTLSNAGCLQRDTFVTYDCCNPSQYRMAYGSLYVSVTSQFGSEAARRHFLPVAEAIMQRNPQQDLALPDPFNLPDMKKWRKNLVYIQGPIGLQNSLYPWQEIFLTVRFGMYAIYLPGPKNSIYLARIKFETGNDMMRFLRLAGLMMNGFPIPNTSTNNGIYREFQQLDDQTIYFLQSQEPWPINALLKPGN
jgi:hypothetical protein